MYGLQFIVKGYEKSKVNLYSALSNGQEQLIKLTKIKNNLITELQHYENNIKINKALMRYYLYG